MPGKGLRRLMSDGRFVRNRSSMAVFRSGKSTICCKPLSENVLRNALLTPNRFWFPVVVLVDRDMSGRSKLPVSQKGALLLERTMSMISLHACSAWIWSPFGGRYRPATIRGGLSSRLMVTATNSDCLDLYSSSQGIQGLVIMMTPPYPSTLSLLDLTT